MKDQAAVALAKKRWRGTTAQDREDFARAGGEASAAALTPEERIERARQAGRAPKRRRRKV